MRKSFSEVKKSFSRPLVDINKTYNHIGNGQNFELLRFFLEIVHLRKVLYLKVVVINWAPSANS